MLEQSEQLEQSIKRNFLSEIMNKIRSHVPSAELGNYFGKCQDLLPTVTSRLLAEFRALFNTFPHLIKHLTGKKELDKFTQIVMHDFVAWGMRVLEVGAQAKLQGASAVAAFSDGQSKSSRDDEDIASLPNDSLRQRTLDSIKIITIQDYHDDILREFPIPQAIDERKPWIEGREPSSKVCRLDSLARLLGLSDRYSVCSAAALYCPAGLDRRLHKLVLAMNKHDCREVGDIQGASEQRLKRIRNVLVELFLLLMPDFKTDFIFDLSSDQLVQLQRNFEAYSRPYESRIHQKLIEQLIDRVYGTSLPPLVYQQAIFKIFHALFIDQTTFTRAEKNCILFAEVEYLVPSQRLFASFQSLFDEIRTPMITLKDHEMSVVHAEQLIALYFLRANRAQTAAERVTMVVPIGISKLCCETCYRVLHYLSQRGNIQFEARGGHSQAYNKVLSLVSMEETVVSRDKLWAVTCAKPSPFVSPFLGATAVKSSDDEEEQELQFVLGH
jgi:hypothetical protein